MQSREWCRAKRVDQQSRVSHACNGFESFQQPAKDAVKNSLASAKAKSSPIMAAMQDIAIDQFSGDEVQGIPEILIVISDMLEYTRDYSQYPSAGDLSYQRFQRSPAYLKFRTDLHDARVTIEYVRRKDLPAKFDIQHMKFWHKWIQDNRGVYEIAHACRGWDNGRYRSEGVDFPSASSAVFCFLRSCCRGAATLSFPRSRAVGAFYVTLVPVLFMIGYALLLGLARLFRLRDDQSGDNLYYMGFLFTLTSLAVSLYQFSTAGSAAQIVQNFGIAIASTIAGIALRILFNQMRRRPHRGRTYSAPRTGPGIAQGQARNGKFGSRIQSISDERRSNRYKTHLTK